MILSQKSTPRNININADQNGPIIFDIPSSIQTTPMGKNFKYKKIQSQIGFQILQPQDVYQTQPQNILTSPSNQKQNLARIKAQGTKSTTCVKSLLIQDQNDSKVFEEFLLSNSKAKNNTNQKSQKINKPKSAKKKSNSKSKKIINLNQLHKKNELQQGSQASNRTQELQQQESSYRLKQQQQQQQQQNLQQSPQQQSDDFEENEYFQSENIRQIKSQKQQKTKKKKTKSKKKLQRQNSTSSRPSNQSSVVKKKPQVQQKNKLYTLLKSSKNTQSVVETNRQQQFYQQQQQKSQKKSVLYGQSHNTSNCVKNVDELIKENLRKKQQEKLEKQQKEREEEQRKNNFKTMLSEYNTKIRTENKEKTDQYMISQSQVNGSYLKSHNILPWGANQQKLYERPASQEIMKKEKIYTKQRMNFESLFPEARYIIEQRKKQGNQQEEEEQFQEEQKKVQQRISHEEAQKKFKQRYQQLIQEMKYQKELDNKKKLLQDKKMFLLLKNTKKSLSKCKKVPFSPSTDQIKHAFTLQNTQQQESPETNRSEEINLYGLKNDRNLEIFQSNNNNNHKSQEILKSDLSLYESAIMNSNLFNKKQLSNKSDIHTKSQELIFE